MSQVQQATVQQLDALLDFLDDHRELARGHLRCADGREKSRRLWEEATQMLNSIGGSVKTAQQWQKVWTDRKHLAKKTAAANRRSAAATGGGPSQHITLSPWEQGVLEIMGEGFGEPQTSASVPAFRQNWDFEEEVASYSASSPSHSSSHSLSIFQSQSLLVPQTFCQPSSFPQSPFVTQALSQSSLVTQASPRPPSAPRASSQRSLIARSSSQPPLIPQGSSQSPLISQDSPPFPLMTQSSAPSPLIAQSSSEPPLIPQESSSSQQRNNSAGRSRTERGVTSRRGAAAERSLQQRFFGFEAKRLQLEQQKIAELRGLRQQHAQ